MPDWRVHTITDIYDPHKVNGSLCFFMLVHVDKQIEWKDGESKSFVCHTFRPFTTWKVGDWIEIDFDKTRRLVGSWWEEPLDIYDNNSNIIKDTDVIKSFELPTGVSSEMQRRIIEAQRSGTTEGEFIAAQGSTQSDNFSYEKFTFNKYAGNFFYERR